MSLPTVILAIIGIIGAAGGTTAYYSRSRGKGTIDLLQTNIEAYKDAEKLKDAQIVYLKGQLVAKDDTIANLNRLIKDSKEHPRRGR
jgi:hypothetical protein